MKSIRQQKKKYNKKIFILICLLIISLLPFVTTFSRYAIKKLNEFFNKSQEFYFKSDKLGEDDPLFLIDNWSGVDDYQIQINMNSMENNILSASYDINYNISYTCSNNILCTLSKTSGTISQSTNRDFFILTVIPNAELDTGDEVSVNITATADSPYEATLTGRFVLKVGKENITYTIDDSESSQYFNVNITNTQSYYTVDTAFSSYSVGKKITIDEYLSLTDENKSKCHSALITLSFNPEEVLIDMTNSNYLNAIDIKKVQINSYEYVNEITFKVDAISSSTVRFYKVNVDEDYTYPNSSDYSIVTFESK
jgi:hypothetical protein